MRYARCRSTSAIIGWGVDRSYGIAAQWVQRRRRRGEHGSSNGEALRRRHGVKATAFPVRGSVRQLCRRIGALVPPHNAITALLPRNHGLACRAATINATVRQHEQKTIRAVVA
jgi:hypothetical protein